jgi:PIN domain nuclease of toxin-antitoxin system
MTVLDAFAVVALLRGEPAAPEVRPLLESGDAVLTALGLAEVIDHLVHVVGASDEEAALDVAQLGLTDALVVDADLGLRAGLLRSRHYHRTQRAVSLADCVAAEAARTLGTGLVTADPHLLELCRDERIASIPIPDASGSRWSP